MRERAPTIGIMDNDRQALLAIASGLRKLLPDFRLLWAVDTATAAITRCTSRMTQPTVMLADMSMEDIAGIATCRTIRRETSNVAILAMSSFLLDTYASDAADAGTQGIVSKRDTRRIAKAIEAVAAGHTWNDASNPSLAFRSPPSAQAWVRSHKSVTLSSAQTQVVELRNDTCCPSRGSLPEKNAACTEPSDCREGKIRVPLILNLFGALSHLVPPAHHGVTIASGEERYDSPS